MSNVRFPAAAEGMPKFNCQQIMSEAWAIYRRETRTSRPTRIVDRKKLFARCLRSAWAGAKHRAAEAAKSLSQRAADRVQELMGSISTRRAGGSIFPLPLHRGSQDQSVVCPG